MFSIEKTTVSKPTLVGQPKKTREAFAVVGLSGQVGCTFYKEEDAKQFLSELTDAQQRGPDFFAAFLSALDKS